MINKIENVEEVSTYFIELFNEGVNAHPDDDFTTTLLQKKEDSI